MNVPLPTRVMLGQCLASGVLGLGAAMAGPAVGLGPAAGWSVVAGAMCGVLPGALVAHWQWWGGLRRGAAVVMAAMMQTMVKLSLSGLMLAGVLGGLAGVDSLAVLAGFMVAVIVQPLVLIWASARDQVPS
jgi:hypothetical protein